MSKSKPPRVDPRSERALLETQSVRPPPTPCPADDILERHAQRVGAILDHARKDLEGILHREENRQHDAVVLLKTPFTPNVDLMHASMQSAHSDLRKDLVMNETTFPVHSCFACEAPALLRIGGLAILERGGKWIQISILACAEHVARAVDEVRGDTKRREAAMRDEEHERAKR